MSNLRFSVSNIVLFFVGLFVLIALGDDKQGSIDVIGASLFLFLYLINTLTGAGQHKPSTFFQFTWLAFFTYLILNSFIISDSPGYSVIIIIRYAMAYLAFSYFAFSERETTAKKFAAGIFWFAAASVGVSFLTLIFSQLGSLLPEMNLLYPTYGHNHIVNIIIFILPLIVYELMTFKNIIVISSVAYFTAALLLSKARGIWILSTAYLVWVIFTLRKHFQLLPKVILSFVFMGLVGTIIFFQPTFLYQSNSTAPKPMVKGSILDSRANYWKQAWYAIKSRPIFGSGPGTYYLNSKRFQKDAISSSWYAHNFPLQTISELGIVGWLSFSLVLGYPLLIIIRSLKAVEKSDYFHVALWQGIMLVIIYSFFEMILDFLVVWLLFWATLGFLYRQSMILQKTNHQKQTKNILVPAICVVLALYYVSAVSATLLDFVGRNHRVAFILQPYSANRAITYLTKESAKSIYTFGLPEKMIAFFHRKNPEIAFNMAKYATFSSSQEAFPWYYLAVDGDPQNQTYLSAYLDQINLMLPQKEAGSEIKRLLANVERKSAYSTLFSIENLDEHLGEALKDVHQNSPFRWNEKYVGLAYVLAMQLLPDRPDISEQLLLYARDIYPDIGFIHVEIARFFEHVKNDHQAAVDALEYCQKFQSPKKQCREENVDSLPPTGEFMHLFVK